MNLIIFATCFFTILICGSAIEQTTILKSSMEIMFANFENIDPKNGKSVRDKLLANLLKPADDEKVASNFHSLISDLYDKGSPQLKEAVLNFNNSVQNVEPDELKEVLLELQNEGASTEKRQKRQEENQNTTPIIEFTMKDIPRIKYSKTENKTRYKPKSVKNLLELVLQKNHSEAEIESLHKDFHDQNSSLKFGNVDLRHQNGNPKSILNMVLQKNHSEEMIEKLHKDFHKPEPKQSGTPPKLCTGTQQPKIDEAEAEYQIEGIEKNANENMIIRVSPDEGFQIFKK